MVHFGNRIKTLAEGAGMSIPELARRLGKTKPTVYEMLEKEDVNTSILKSVAEIFNIGLADMLADDIETIEKHNESEGPLLEVIADQQKTIRYLREKLEAVEAKGGSEAVHIA